MLAANLLNHYKEVYAATAEVLGVCLQQLDLASNVSINSNSTALVLFVLSAINRSVTCYGV